MSETFPKWVVQRYCDLMNKQEGEHVPSPSMFGGAFGPATLVALRLIQTHEKEPVDHDVRAVATILHEYGRMDVNFYVEAGVCAGRGMRQTSASAMNKWDVK